MGDSRFGRLVTAMVTPFDDNLDVDLNRTEELSDRLVKSGTDSVIVCGTTGESPTVSAPDKLRVIEAVVHVVGGRIPVVANVGSNCTHDTIDFAREADKLGVDGFMCVVPYYNKPPQEGLYRHFKAVAESTEKPIILYNIPSRCVVNMKAETTLRLANECRNIVAVKEASGDIEQVKCLVEGAPDGFGVYSGDDSFTYDLMKAGGTGVVSTTSNVAPAKMKALVEACAEREWQRASELNEQLMPLMKGLFATTNPILVKAALALCGFKVGGVRLPLVDATDEQVRSLEETLTEVGVL